MAKKVVKWIKTDKQPPKEEKIVLGCWTSEDVEYELKRCKCGECMKQVNKVVRKNIMRVMKIRKHGGNIKWYNESGGELMPPNYWMDLPSPPNES